MNRFACLALLATGLLLTGFAETDPLTISAERRILLIAGPASHGWNEHEFPDGIQLLAQGLQECAPTLQVATSVGVPIPGNPLYDQTWDAVLLYSDGTDRHVAIDHVPTLRRWHQQGSGFVILHFALEPPTDDSAIRDFLLESVGGFFDVESSVNPIWELKNPQLATHPITQGVSPFELEDEWYFYLRFVDSEKLQPILLGMPPLDTLGSDGPRSGNAQVRKALTSGEPQILGWCYTAEQGQRGFGLTGGHFHSNWAKDELRTLVINALLWTAGLPVPENGSTTSAPLLVRYRTLEEAIARGDPQDVKMHLALDPSAIDRPGRGAYNPLHLAVLRQQTAVVDILLAAGCNVNLLTSANESALHLAVRRDTAEIVGKLMQAGIDFTQQDRVGWTALHHAAAESKTQCLRILLEYPGTAQVLTAAGGTPLHEAGASGDAETVNLLLESGVDPAHRAHNGKTAHDLAVEFGNEAAQRALERWSLDNLPEGMH